MLRRLLDNIELVLSVLGILIIIILPSLLIDIVPSVDTPLTTLWEITAITASAVGVLHGIIFWIIRYRQRVVRRKTLHDVRMMLDDVIKNQLAVISLNAQLARPEAKRLERITGSITEISEALNSLSEEKLVYWQHKYEAHLKNESDSSNNVLISKSMS